VFTRSFTVVLILSHVIRSYARQTHYTKVVFFSFSGVSSDSQYFRVLVTVLMLNSRVCRLQRVAVTLQDTFDTRVCMSQTQKYTIDFTTASESDLQDVIIPLTFDMQQSGHVHGLAFWFEVAFIGSQFVLDFH